MHAISEHEKLSFISDQFLWQYVDSNVIFTTDKLIDLIALSIKRNCQQVQKVNEVMTGLIK